MPDIDHNAWIMVCRNVKRELGMEIIVDTELAGDEGIALVASPGGRVSAVVIAGGEGLLLNFQRAIVSAQLARFPEWLGAAVGRLPVFARNVVFYLTAKWVVRKVRVAD